MASQHRAEYAEFAKKSAAAQHQEAIMPVAGIDLHATYLVVTIVSNEGSILQKPRRIRNSDADGLVDLLEVHKPLEVVVEASGMWPWLFDRLDSPDVHAILAHPKRLRAIADSNYKTDAVDAELLARMRLVDLIPEVFPKPPEQRERATLVRHRTRLVRTRTAALGRIHAELHSIGVTLPRGRLLTGTGRTWVHTEAWPLLRPQQRLLIQTHERLIDQLSMMIKGLDKQVRHIGRRIPAVQLLETIPGIGPFRALLIATEVEPISRFHSPKHLVSYAGLAPRSTRSGQSVRYGSVPAGANRWLRGAFVQSVLRHYHTTPDSWLSLFYEEKKERLGWRVARIAAARRLARATHAMLRSGEVWSDA
jgi:transposase